MFILGYLALCFLTGFIAHGKGRSAFGFFLLSFLLSPLIGLIAVLVARQDTEKVEKNAVSSGSKKKCPYCAEVIKQDASICRFCGKDVPLDRPEKLIGVEGHKTTKIGEYTKFG